ncbi:MAG: MOSC domain-containing protein, partial [Desulfuromonas sp.]
NTVWHNIVQADSIIHDQNWRIDMKGQVVAVCLSHQTGERKTPVDRVELRENHGIIGDAHAGDWHRQISLLAKESIDKMRAVGLDVNSGDFAENLTTVGINLPQLPLGTRFGIGSCLLELTQIGKKCHNRCAIYHQAGDCVMPKEGVFAKVLCGGFISSGDPIEIIPADEKRPGPEVV